MMTCVEIVVPWMLASMLSGGAETVPPCHEPTEPEADYRRSVESYSVPRVILEDDRGRSVALATELDASRPVVLNFVFTSCRTICPVMSATFAGLRDELGQEARALRMVSISIDPEYDTPPVLKKYSTRFDGGKGWRFLTGDLETVVAVQKAFGAYAGAKANHRPLTFLRGTGEKDWVRIEGLVSTTDLAREVRQLLAGASPE